MTKRTNGKSLNPQQIANLISDWENKTVAEFAEEFGTSVAIVRNCAYKIRKLYPDKCPKKTRRGLEDTIHEAIRILDQAETSDTTDTVAEAAR